MDSFRVVLTIPTFNVSAVFGFRSAGEASVVHECVSGHVSGARLPFVEWNDDPPNTGAADVVVSVWDHEEDLLVQFSGAVQTPPYRVDKAGFHWDFSRVFTSLIIPRIVLQGIIPVHAATVVTDAGAVLLPGMSGAGKSSIAFAAYQFGLVVPASELSFVRGGMLITGNTSMTIDSVALTRYGVEVPSDAVELDGRVTLPTSYHQQPLRLSRVVFPRVSQTSLNVRAITDRRARMLLYQNVVAELPVGAQLAHETHPVGIVPTLGELEIIAKQVELLSHLGPSIVEGSPEDVVAYISTPGVATPS